MYKNNIIRQRIVILPNLPKFGKTTKVKTNKIHKSIQKIMKAHAIKLAIFIINVCCI
jgi:hypothetical protein